VGISFQWRTSSDEQLPPVEWRALVRRRPARWMLALVVLPVLVAGLAAWQVRSRERAVAAELQRLVEQEVLALQAGQRDILMSLLQGAPLHWRRYHEQCFYRESAWYAARPGAQVRVEGVRLTADGAEATVTLSDGRDTRPGTWYFTRVSGRWCHTAPPLESSGASCTAEAGPILVVASGADCAIAEQLAPELEALYRLAAETYGLKASSGDAKGQEGPMAAGPMPRPERIRVDIEPTARAVMLSVSYSSHMWSFSVASPRLALELWSEEERSAHTRATVRLGVGWPLLQAAWWSEGGSPDWLLAQGLAAWHAQACQPTWREAVAASLEDGSPTLFLRLWAGDDLADEEAAGPLLDTLAARFNSSGEAFTEWCMAMAYTVGEFLGERYPPEQLARLLRASAGQKPVWKALEAELGLTRAEFEAGWLAHLEERYGRAAQ